MAYRFEPGLDIEIAGTIDTAGGLIRILKTDNADMRRRRQIGLAIMRAQIMGSPLPLPMGASALGTDAFEGRHRGIGLAPRPPPWR